MKKISCLLSLFVVTICFAANGQDMSLNDRDLYFSKAIGYLEKAENLAESMHVDSARLVAETLSSYIEKLKLDYKAGNVAKMSEETTMLFEILDEVLCELKSSDRKYISNLVYSAFKELAELGVATL